MDPNESSQSTQRAPNEELEKEAASSPADRGAFSTPDSEHQHRSAGGAITKRTGADDPIQIRDRIKELRRVRAKDLLPNPKNWRRHPKAQAAALRELLAEVGYADALLVRELPDGRLMIIDGHLRAETTPDSIVPVLVLDVTEEEADKILLTLDPLAAMAESDAERIKALLTTVRTDSEAVQELLKRIAGPKLWEILHPEDVEEAAVSLDRADELRAKWGTETGQLWQIGPHRIVCGDCANPDVVARLMGNDRPPMRMVWTDPPYGVDYGAKTDWIHQHGGGSTILAAHQLGRIGYGCEIDPGYVAVELERLSLLGLKPEVIDR